MHLKTCLEFLPLSLAVYNQIVIKNTRVEFSFKLTTDETNLSAQHVQTIIHIHGAVRRVPFKF